MTKFVAALAFALWSAAAVAQAPLTETGTNAATPDTATPSPEQQAFIGGLEQGPARQIAPPLRLDPQTGAFDPSDAAFLTALFKRIVELRASRFEVVLEVPSVADNGRMAQIFDAFLPLWNGVFRQSQSRLSNEPVTFTTAADNEVGLRVERVGEAELTGRQRQQQLVSRNMAMNQIRDLGLNELLWLPPITFRPGTAELTPDSQDYLDTLAGIIPYDQPGTFRTIITLQTQPGVGSADAGELEARRISAVLPRINTTGDMVIEMQPEQLTPNLPLAPLLNLTLLRYKLKERIRFDWDVIEHAPPRAEAIELSPDLAIHSFPLDAPRLLQNFIGAVDVWVEPAWSTAQGYDPTVLALADGISTRLSLHILEDRSGIAIFNGLRGPAGYLSIPVDLTGNRPYHIALSTVGQRTVVYVDGVALEPALPIGYGTAAAATLILGDDALGESPFPGRIARPRVWHTDLTGDEVARMRVYPYGIPDDDDEIQDKLAHVIERDFKTGALSRRQADPWIFPRTGWWAPADAADIRLQNSADFLAGKAAPQFSQTAADWAAQNNVIAGADRTGADFDRLTRDRDARFNPHFTLRKALKIEADRGIDLDALRLPERFVGGRTDRHVWELGRRNWGLRISTSADGVQRVAGAICSDPGDGPSGRICRDALPTGEEILLFAEDEELRAIRWYRYGNAIRRLVFVTDRRISPPYGAEFAEGDTASDHYELYLPAGLRPTTMVVRYQDDTRNGVVGLGLDYDARNAKAGLTMVSETGSAVRFARKFADRFTAIQTRSALIDALAGRQVDNAEIQLRSDSRIVLFGAANELIFQSDRVPAAQPNDSYNNTFVALSKAVNLRSSFAGYHLLKMDPLHLIRTGASGAIFREPEGLSRDYYDANRIFVPLGLHYVPEFTGRNHARVVTADTYAEYLDSFSDTVSAGVGGKLAPVSFSASATMTSARQTISEQKQSKTRGLSRAVFYDLVIDKQHVRLSDRFIAAVEDLAERGGYAAFIEVFGTHYPLAVIYGGLGVLEIDATEHMHQTMQSQGIDIKLEASVLLDAETKTRASFGYEHKEEHQQTFRDTMGSQTENFYWIGGTHAGAEHSSWSVATDGVVPVHVSLRPIDELLSPVFFEDPAVYTTVRTALRASIAATVGNAGNEMPPPEPDQDRYALEIRVDKVACNDGSSDDFREPNQFKVAGVMQRLPRVSAKQFPVITTRAIDGEGFRLRNLEAPSPAPAPKDDDKAEKSQLAPVSVFCPSHDNILARLPYAQANALSRYMFRTDDLRRNDVVFDVLNRVEIEDTIVNPPPETKDVAIDEVVGFLTGGLNIAAETLFTDAGSPLLNAVSRRAVGPKGYGEQFRLRQVLCTHAGICNPTNDALDAIAGQWFSIAFALAPRADCPWCRPRAIDFSFRILK